MQTSQNDVISLRLVRSSKIRVETNIICTVKRRVKNGNWNDLKNTVCAAPQGVHKFGRLFLFFPVRSFQNVFDEGIATTTRERYRDSFSLSETTARERVRHGYDAAPTVFRPSQSETFDGGTGLRERLPSDFQTRDRNVIYRVGSREVRVAPRGFPRPL